MLDSDHNFEQPLDNGIIVRGRNEGAIYCVNFDYTGLAAAIGAQAAYERVKAAAEEFSRQCETKGLMPQDKEFKASGGNQREGWERIIGTYFTIREDDDVAKIATTLEQVAQGLPGALDQSQAAARDKKSGERMTAIVAALRKFDGQVISESNRPAIAEAVLRELGQSRNRRG